MAFTTMHFPIDETLARQANDAYSMDEYKSGRATAEYERIVEEFEQEVDRLIETRNATDWPLSDAEMTSISSYAERYSAKLAAAINQQHSIQARCPSALIAGFANFPVRKKEKQNAAMAKFYEENGQLFEPTENYFFRKIRNIASDKTIYSNDANVLQRLQARLAQLESNQEQWKRVNAYWRKHGTMAGYGLSEEAETRINEKMKINGLSQPIPGWRLTNNNAEIHRVRDRIAELERLKEQADAPADETGQRYPEIEGVTVRENSEAMRIELYFDEKPTDEARMLLKGAAFKWAPSKGAWQRQLTSNAVRATQRLLKSFDAAQKG